MKDCPVCGKAGLADNVQACTQCNADLECFDLLDSLHEEVVTPGRSEPDLTWTRELEDIRTSVVGIREALSRPQHSGWMRIYGLAALFALGLAALFLFVYLDFAHERRFDDRISELELRTSLFDAGLEAKERSGLSAKIAAITQRLAAVSANQGAAGARFSVTLERLDKIAERLVSLEEGLSGFTAERPTSTDEPTVPSGLARENMFLYHEPHKGETLWSIARRHYGSGRFYPLLLEYNPGLGIYFDHGYGRIRILKDRQRAKELLADLVATQGNRTLFRYKVMEGDTWRQISKRFFGQTGKAAELASLNLPVSSTPGERVLVPLP